MLRPHGLTCLLVALIGCHEETAAQTVTEERCLDALAGHIREDPSSPIARGHQPVAPGCRISLIFHERLQPVWEEVARVHTDDPEALFAAARGLTLESLRSAEQVYQRLRTIEPDHWRWAYFLGHFYHLDWTTEPGGWRVQDAVAENREALSLAQPASLPMMRVLSSHER